MSTWTSSFVEGVPFIPTSITHVQCEDLDVMVPFALKVMPEWTAGNVSVRRMTDGITNIVVKISHLQEAFVIRIYGNRTDVLIDRKKEIETHMLISQSGFGAPVLALFETGYAYGFVPGTPCTPATFLNNIDNAKLFYTTLARLHTEMPSEGKPAIFETAERWLLEVPKEYSNPKTDAVFKESIDMAYITRKLAEFKEEVESADLATGFCHNDLLPYNIIMSPEQDKLSFLDYEYGNISYFAYDVANHLNELAGLEVKTLDYSRPPCGDALRPMIVCYLTAFHGQEPTDEQTTQFQSWVERLRLLSHLFWSIWALIQAANSTIDFDYIGYARLRLQQVKQAEAEAIYAPN
eukprot:m.40895 g.40895  ORF g.40895 m.40895 type:complete len:350 (-) comp10480_c0_seq2:1983-3032(-)